MVVVVVVVDVYVGKCVNAQACDSQRENSNSDLKTLTLRDSSVRSVFGPI